MLLGDSRRLNNKIGDGEMAKEEGEKGRRNKRSMRYKLRYGVAAGVAIATVLAFSLLMPTWGLGFGLPLAAGAFFLVVGLVWIREKHSAPIERFGRYVRTLKPGLKLIFLPGAVERIKEVLFVEQKGLPLFETPIKVDFKDGSGIPKAAKVYIEINKPDEEYLTDEEKKRVKKGEKIKARTGVYRAVYHIENREEEIKSRVENAVRSFLNGLMLEQGIEMALGGYDLLEANRMPKKEVTRLRETFDDWGTRLIATTIGDFDLESDLVKVRGERHKRIKEREAASEVAKRRAIETVGSLIEMLSEDLGMPREEIQKWLRDKPKKFLEKYGNIVSRDLDIIHRRMGIDGGAYLDIRTVAGEPGKTFLDLIALWKRMPPGRPEEERKERRARGVKMGGEEFEVPEPEIGEALK